MEPQNHIVPTVPHVPARCLMVQGTASSVGKSVLVTALCRIFRQDGLQRRAVQGPEHGAQLLRHEEGGEIGRAQAVQAEAAGIEPSVHMNPVLLKPEADARSQVIVLGKVAANLTASEYYDYTPHLLKSSKTRWNASAPQYDIVVIEGAGSPAEINLKEREIVNMRVARLASAPVLLVGDIDRGGVFASLVGTLELLTEEERDLVKGLHHQQVPRRPGPAQAGAGLPGEEDRQAGAGRHPLFPGHQHRPGGLGLPG